MNSIRNKVFSLAVLLTLVLMMTVPAFAERDRDQREFEGKITVYKQALKDTTLSHLADQVSKNPGDQRLVDQMLMRMPLSPLDMFRIRMESQVREYVVPKEVYTMHQRWMGLHPEVNLLRADAQAAFTVASITNPAMIIMAGTTSTNRNTAATYTPAPTAYDGEIQLAVNKNNANQMVAGANTWNATCDTQTVVSSVDGGTNWRYSCVPTGSQSTPNFGLTCQAGETWLGSDPAIYWDNSNNVYFNYMLMCCGTTCQAGTGNPRSSMVVAKSTDSGLTWAAPTQGGGIIVNHLAAGQTAFDDKQFYNIDTTPTSPYYGRHYTCWDTGNDEQFAYSSNSGSTWTQVNVPASTGTDLGCEIAVQSNGTVHMIFNGLTCGATCTGETTYYTRSTNGGAAWSTPVLIKSHLVYSNFGGTANKIQAANSRGINPFGSIDVDNSGGTYNGRLYVVYSDMASGSDMNLSDTYVARSTDNGATWSAGVKINDDATSTAQFQGTLVVDKSNGAVFVAWEDGRNDTTNKRKIDIYASRSTDGGVTWDSNTKVTANSAEFTNNTGISYTDENSTDNTGANPNNYGEYLGVDAAGGTGYVAWADSRPYYPAGTTNAQKENIGFATVTFSAPTPDFTVAASPTSLSVQQGTSGTSTITVGSLNSFNSAVSLSASGLPSGVTASFSPASVTPPANGSGTSTLTLTASGTATTGTVTVTVTGTSGATHTATISLTITATPTPTFTVAASPASVTVSQGGSGTSTITVASQNSFNSAVSLSASGLPSGVTASFAPASVTPPANGSGTSTLTLTASATATTGTVSVTVTGVSGAITKTATISLTVNPTGGSGITNGTFETGNLTGWTSAGSAAVNTTAKRSGTYGDQNGLTTPTNGDSNIIQTFTVPAGGGTVSFWYKMTCPDSVTYDWVTATLKDNTTAVTTTLLAKTCATNASFVQVTSGALVVGHSMTLTLTSHDDNYASDPSYSYFDDVTFNGATPDFSMSASPSSLAITQGTSGTSTITATSINGFSSAVSLTASGLPSGVTASFSPSSVTPTGTSTLTLTASASATTGAATVTVTGTSGATVHSTTISLTVNPTGVPALTATYSSTYKAPACGNGGKSCDSGASLLNGRGTMTSGIEPNQPNTINNSCADGVSGTYHSDESLDRMSIATNDSSALAAGKAVTATFTAYCYSSADHLDIYYTSNAATPTWTSLGTQNCTAAGVKAFTVTYTLPVGASQAIRGTLRYNGTASACGTNSGYDDHDDLVFGVN